MKTYVLVCSTDRDGVTFGRAPSGSHRLFLAGEGGWGELSAEQRDSVCKVVWATASGRFEIRDAASRAVVGEHEIG